MRKAKIIISSAIALNIFMLSAQNVFAENINIIDAKQITESTNNSSDKLNAPISET